MLSNLRSASTILTHYSPGATFLAANLTQFVNGLNAVNNFSLSLSVFEYSI